MLEHKWIYECTRIVMVDEFKQDLFLLFGSLLIFVETDLHPFHLPQQFW